MNNWRDFNKEPPLGKPIKLRVKYIYYIITYPAWGVFPIYRGLLNDPNILLSSNMNRYPQISSPHQGVGIIHIDPLSEYGIGGFRWSDLKGEHQLITHWMYVDDPYDESEENVDT